METSSSSEIYIVFWFDKEARESGYDFVSEFSMLRTFRNLEDAKKYINQDLETYKNRLAHRPDLQSQIQINNFQFSEYGANVFSFSNPFRDFYYIKCLNSTYIIVKQELY